MAELDVNDGRGLGRAVRIGECDSFWAEGRVGAKAGTMILQGLRVFICGLKVNYAPGHALSVPFMESQSEVRDRFDNFNWESHLSPLWLILLLSKVYFPGWPTR